MGGLDSGSAMVGELWPQGWFSVVGRPCIPENARMTLIQRFPLLLLRALGILLLASALTAPAASVVLTFDSSAPSGITVTNGTLVPINVVASTGDAPVIVSVALNFRTWAPLCTNLWNSLPMATTLSPTNFSATIPRLPASNVDYYASCTYLDEAGNTNTILSAATNTYTVGMVMRTARFQDFEEGNWANSGSPDYNYWSTDGWTGGMMRVGILLRSPGLNASANSMWLRNGTNSMGQQAFIVAPLQMEGVGSLYCEAGVRTQTGVYSNNFAVMYSTNNGANWITASNFSVSGSTIIYPAVSINTRVPTYVKLQRTYYDVADGAVNNSAGVFDNIRVSFPPADLSLSQPTNPVTPLYPQAADPVTFLCNVQDLSTNEPTINQRLNLYYTWISTNGATTNSSMLSMTNVPGVPGQYAATLAPLGAGTNKYYYRCDFDGYYYTNSDKRGPYYFSGLGQTSTNAVPTNKFSYVINYQNIRAIRLLPSNGFSFGLCATNDTRTNTLLICNDGNMPLTVTNIVFDSPDFSTTFTTNFAVAVNSTQSLVVTYAPHSLGAYSNVLWVQTDRTTGTDSNLVTGTGMPVESVSQPVIAGDSGGTLGTVLNFTLTVPATDSWSYVVQNNYNWGDGTFSGWTTNTTITHAWTNVGTFYVQVQGRSATNNSVLSLTSTPVSVTITNTRIMGLSGNLDFGTLGVGVQPLTRVLTITNSGNGSLNVAGITSADPTFTFAPTAFDIPAYGASNVLVTFAPTNAESTVTSLVTVLSGNITSGVNTTNATGAAEQLTIWGLTPTNSAGTLSQALTFTAYATNSSGHALNYRFDWGDTTTSAWLTVATTSHVWAATNSYSVRAQVQCQVDPNAFSTWYGPVTVTITNTRILGLTGSLSFGTVVTNLTSSLGVAVTNTGTGILSVSNVTFTSSAFTAAPTNFVLQPGFGTNVTVTFAPLVAGAYTDTLVMASTATSGTNTLAVSGFAEMMGIPVISPASASGTMGQSLTPFSALATNNTGDTLDYRFDWGDSTTSTWATATNAAHTWSTTNAFNVRAQARCHVHTNDTSIWSGFAVMTITNSRVMVLTPTNLVFGGLMTNQAATSILIISNSGNGPFSVTNIICPYGFSALPTNFPFSVQPSNSVLVTNTFAPQTLGSYTGQVQVLSPDVVNGGGSVSVTGFCEMVSVPLLNNSVTAGHVNDTVTFSAFSTNNGSGHTIQYRFDWGDGTTSAWTTATSTTHVWAATNTFPVRAQASCASDTNVLSAWSAANQVNIYAAPFFTFSTVTNGLPFQVTMTATGAVPATASNCVFYFLPPLSTNAQPTNLTYVSAYNWSTTVPPLSPGSMAYYLQYMRAGVSLRYPAISNNLFAITNYLGIGRQVGFEPGTETWSGSGSPDYNYWCSGWTGTMMRVGILLRSPALNDTANSIWLRNGSNTMGQMAFIMSPLQPAGIGSIYFEAGIRSQSGGYTAGFNVEVSVDQTNWYSFYANNVTGTAVLRPVITVNLRRPAWVRIRRTTYDAADGSSGNSPIVLDNIIISPPPTDVKLTESLHNPGYPNSKDPTLVRCLATDYDPTNAPSSNRRLTVFYKFETSASYSSNAMYSVGGNLFEGVIPVYPAGAMSYYFKCDFDGYYYTNSVITNTAQGAVNYPSERIPSSYLPDQRVPTMVGPFAVLTQYPAPVKQSYGSTLPDILGYTINFFRSADASMYLQTTPSSVATPMSLVADYTWQALTLMTGITNLTWYFAGSQHYSNDATSLVPVLYWGDTNQDFSNPPLGGTADPTADLTTNALRATLSYNGFLVYQFTTTNQNYLVKRAVYQDFNNWQASQNFFAYSLGLYAITTFTNDFSTWGTNYFSVNERWRTENFQSESLNIAYGDSEHLTTNWWAYREAVPIAERAYQAPLFNSTINQALQLSSASSAQGQLWNTSDSLTEGIHNFAFRARLAQNDGRYALYLGSTNGTGWASGYRITNTLDAASMSPGKPSLSLLFCYYRNYINPFDFGSYYELKMTQISDTSPADAKMQLDLIRWKSGVSNEIPGFPLTCNSQQLTATPPLQIDVSWSNQANTAVVFTGNVSRAGTILFAWSTNTVDVAPGGLQYGGTLGFLCSDAAAEIRALGVFTGTNLDVNSQIPMAAYNSSSNASYWYFGQTTLPACWSNNAANNLVRSPSSPPSLGVYSIRTGVTGVRDPDLSTYTNVTSITVTSFNYTSISLPMNLWDQTYVMLQYASGDLPIVVDDLALDPWRGYTRGYNDSNWNNQATLNGVQFWDWTSTTQQFAWAQNGSVDEQGWLIFEGLIATSLGNTYATFDVSRANPSLSQGLWSPVLTNGIGSLAFQATVANGTSVYRVESTSPNDPTVWLPQQTFTNTYGDAAVNCFVPVQQTNMSGRIRVVQVPSSFDISNNWVGGSSPGAILNIDNLVAYDYPAPDATTWIAYNCLIARSSTNNFTSTRAFETNAASYAHQSCYLNNSATNNVLSPGNLSAHNPYVQTPMVDTGIGQIAFWYRAWDTNAAYVSIQVAPNSSTPDSQWTVVTNFVVTNLTYQYFDSGTTIFDTDDQVMRIYVTNSVPTPTTGRLCIDNIIMTEPIRAGYDITGVTLLPVQPLTNDLVGVQATIGRFLMSPQNIQLYLSYYQGTNIWGYANWRGRGVAVSNTCVTIPMVLTQAGGTTYSTPPGTNIPRGNIDDVVQYIVWGTYSNLIGRPVFQDTNTFVNPSWYYPIDRNPTNTLGVYLAPTNWSPYYYVFSCPPASVWINEINYVVMPLQEQGDEYIELCGRVNYDISNWRLDVIDPLNNFNLYNQAVVPSATQIHEEYLSDGSLSVDGWGFWVYGGSYVYLPGPLDEWGYPGYLPPNLTGNDTQQTLLLQNAGLRLVRSMGAYEERICYGPSAINAELVAQGYTYIGAKHTLPPWPAPLQLQGVGTNTSDFYWYQPSSYNNSPGAINTDQQLPTLTYTLISAIGLHGSHNIGVPPTSPLVAVTVAAGSSTTIVYTADSWYRISALRSNGYYIPAASNQIAYTWAITNISQNYSNNVTFSLVSTNTNNVPTAWLASWGQSESAALYTTNLDYLYQEYLHNANPYQAPSLYAILTLIGANGSAYTNGISLVSGVPFSLPAGSSTSIVYTANEWYRIQNLATNSIAVAEAVGYKAYTQQINNIWWNYSNNITFYQPTNINSISTNLPTAWLASWGQLESTAFYTTNQAYLYQEYLHNANPYQAPALYTILTLIGANGSAYTNGVALVSGVPFSLPAGSSTSIVYTANEWCRIQSLATNSIAVAAVVGYKAYTQQVVNVWGNLTNSVTYVQPPATNFNAAYTNVTTAWLAGWGRTESASFYNNGSFTLQQEYLLGVNPYAAETYSFNVTAIAVTNTAISVSVNLKTNAADYTLSLTNGTLYLYGYTNLAISGAVIGSTNLVSGSGTFRFTDTGSNKFYRAQIQ